MSTKIPAFDHAADLLFAEHCGGFLRVENYRQTFPSSKAAFLQASPAVKMPRPGI
jgi:hypothetical protein